MARLPRIIVPGQPQHVIQRGNNRETIFVVDEDYRFYLEKLGEGCQRHDCELHAYVLMTNHVHLLITPYAEEGLGKVLQWLGRYYVQYFNHRYKRSGTLWEGRYKATLLNSEQYLLICYRYIELNPVRAGMVNHPVDYPWSSYHANALGKPDEYLVPHALYQRLGCSENERQNAYRQLFKHHIEERTLKEIRDSTNKAWVLGNGRFREKVEKLTQRQAAPKAKGGDRRSKAYREAKTDVIWGREGGD